MKPSKRKQRPGPASVRPVKKVAAPLPEVSSSRSGRDLGLVISTWAVLVLLMWLLGKQNLSAPGLYYDEAVFAGPVKEFLTGRIHGQHMPGFEVTQLFGRPFPVFIQSYLGALKSWMLMPSFQFFGYTEAVLRASNLFWGSIALLFFMLGSWRWLGIRPALIAGALLAFDPAYFFLCLFDWGVAVPSFLCRCIAFFLLVTWWKSRRPAYAFLTTFFAGLGFFNKIDFAVVLIAVTIAGIICAGRTLWIALKNSISTATATAAGFLIGAGAILLKVPTILRGQLSGSNPGQPGELSEKIHTMLALYDGSYFYRLLNVGGMFEKMYSEPVGAFPLLGLLVLGAGVICLVRRGQKHSNPTGRIALFLFAAITLATIGIILLPGAVRIHHAVLAYPLPQLIIAFVAAELLKRSGSGPSPTAVRLTTWIVLLGLLISDSYAIYRTQQLVRATGGRGRWSESFDTFCRENKDRADLTIISLDWGFNEQLNFLTDGPRLSEPFWGRGPFPTFGESSSGLPTDPSYIYLIHPAEYSLLPFGEHYLQEAQTKRPDAEIHPYLDRQKKTAFYTIQFPPR